MDSNKCFTDKGIYKLKESSGDQIFLCESLSGKLMGKLSLYNKVEEGYIRSGNSFFLNAYQSGDLKELVTARENYDMLGILGINYKKIEDKIVES